MYKKQKATRKNYHGIWRRFNEFVIRLDNIPKKWEDKLNLYCAYLVEEKKVQSSTLRSYVSAIKQTLILDKYKWDEEAFLLSTFTETCCRENDHVMNRLPIQKGLLELILFQVDRMVPDQDYIIILYRVVFITAYYGLLRISELAGEHAIKAKDVHIDKRRGKMLIILHTSKTHHKGQRHQEVTIKAQN